MTGWRDRIGAWTLVKWLVALLAAVLIAIFWGIPLAAAFVLFCVAFILDIEPAVAFAIALLILAVCALLVLLSQVEAAKILAMWSYCFMAIGIAVQFYHFLVERRSGEEDVGE